jgi:glycosyltransferase involved in cell wall biosynthesis
MYKLLFITNHPSPHMADLFRAIHRHPAMELQVIFGASADPSRPWGSHAAGFPNTVLPRVPISTPLPLNAGIIRYVLDHARRGYRPIVDVYTMPSSLISACVLVLARKPWLLFSEAPGLDYLAGGMKSSIRAFCVRQLAQRAAGVLAVSRNAVRTYRQICPEARVEHFQYYMEATKFREIRRDCTSRSKGLRFLFCGSLYPLKAPDEALMASELLQENGLPHTLIFAGSGPMEAELRKYSHAHGLSNVEFRGSVAWHTRHEVFSDGDVLVHPTKHDGWGMVVAEALAAGMPVITTEACGAGVDFVRDGVNGFLLGSRHHTGSLAERMAHFIRFPAELERMGKAARKSVRDWTPEAGAGRLCQILSRWFPSRGVNPKARGRPPLFSAIRNEQR